MARLVRKNLIVDADTLSELAHRLGTSESEAVRQSVRRALGGQQMMAALEGLHELGAFADFETLFPSLELDSARDQGSKARARDRTSKR